MDRRPHEWFRALGAAEIAAYRQEIQARGKIRIAEFLTGEKADCLAEQLAAHQSWLESAAPPDNPFHFHYAFAAPGLTEGNVDDGPFVQLAEALQSTAFAERLRDLTGFSEAFSVDIQATQYGPGDFIDEHNDDPPGCQRRYAYVLNLTRDWRAELGGLLLFPHEDQTVSGYVPGFNTLVLFAVPMRHCVTPVAAHARAKRYAVSGWIRLPA